MQKEQEKTGVRFGPAALGLLVAGMIFAVGCIVVAYVYYQARSTQVSSIRGDLERLARLVAAQIDGDKHRQILSPQQQDSFMHELLLEPMIAFHNAAPDIERVYTMTPRSQGGYSIVLDTSQKIDLLKRKPGNLKPIAIMEPYSGNFAPEDQEAIRKLGPNEVYSTSEPYTDRFGTYMSGLAPVVDSSGNTVAYAGVDLPIDVYNQRMAEVRGVATGGIILSLILSGMLGSVAAWIQFILIKAEAVKNQARRRSLQSLEELEYNQKLLKSIAEMNRIILSEPDLSRSINEALRLVGKTAGVDRVYLMHHPAGMSPDKPQAEEHYEWARTGMTSHMDNREFQPFSYNQFGLRHWYERFVEEREVFCSLPGAERADADFLARFGIRSLFCCPIVFDNTCWGFMAFEDCRRERNWTEEQRAIFAASARNLGAAIKRNVEEDARRVADERFRAIFRQSPIGMVIQTADGIMLHSNQAFLGVIGCTEEDIAQRSYRELFPEDRLEEVEQERALMMEKGWSGPFQSELFHKNGHRVSVVFQNIMIDGREGEKQVVTFIEDITRRLEHEREMRKALADADAANRAKSEFLATMSHEIRTPMNGVVGMTGLLMESELTAQQRDYVETIQLSGESLLAIISDILDFSKIEAGRMDFDKAPFSVRDCVESTLELLGPKAAEKGLRMAYRLADGMPETFLGDATRIRQVLFNLVGNAVKFTEEGEVSILVNARLQNSGFHEVTIDVHDTGIGISQEQMTRLFKSFSQLDTSSTRRHGGTGLGLVISQKLLERMGGRIWVDSVVEKGTVFHVVVPMKSVHNNSDEVKEPAAVPYAGKSVMIVESHTLTREYYTRQLKTLGLRVEAFRSAHECLAWSKLNGNIDLVLIAQDLKNYDACRLAIELDRIYEGKLSLVLLRASNARLSQNYTETFELALPPTYRLNTLSKYMADALKLSTRPLPPVRQAPSAQSSAEGEERRQLNILMAEDNKVNQKVTGLLLKKMGYSADIANNGLEVLDAMRKRHYDVILMDMHMPEMDGLEATRNIRESYARDRQPYIIALTASAFQDFKQECHEAGVNAFLTKPLRSEELKKYLTRLQDGQMGSTATGSPQT
ncbi:response regulator [Ruficoccus amylovorans]|uniref:Sensory/regulatory protein RpfC n=1 Tax=Ruficoccus amylovorans TaxID=1804625 RepID=A0A842HBL8_9BACT|nr:response regulator [Ruficoccus amylovorans]MBC2592964.1 response regulator [Ruficoccus amylovorans]